MRQPLEAYEDHDRSIGLVGEDRQEEQREEPRRRLPAALLTLVLMAVFAGGLWFAYTQGAKHATVSGSSSGNVPLIRADDRPTKVKPDQPGGLEVPDRDKLIFNEKSGAPPVERLLPPPEKPAPRPAPAPRRVAAAPPPEAASTQAPPGDAPKAPKAATAQQAAAPAKPAQPEEAKPAAPATPAAAAKPATPPVATPTQPASAGGIRVQLGSVRTPEAAREEWNRLKQANPEILGKLSAVAVRADLGDKGTYYRIQAGPFADAGAADRVCGELKKRNLGCALAR